MKKLVQTRIAGVTFANDDGESRQDIIASLPAFITCELIPTYYDNQFAIKVREETTKKIIGWIPKENLDSNLAKYRILTGTVEKTKNTWHVVAYPAIEPTVKQCKLVKLVCDVMRIPKPAYDKRAYNHFLNIARQRKWIDKTFAVINNK